MEKSLNLLFYLEKSLFPLFYFANCPKNVTFASKSATKGTAKVIKMIKLFIISVLIIAICMALFSVKVIFKKNGKFSSQHIHDNPGLRKQGIHCVMDQDREAREAGKAY